MDLLEVDPVTGKRTSLATTIRRALVALHEADIPFAVIGATALAVRGFPRMTRDLDVVVLREDGFAAIDALLEAGFVSGKDEVDVLVASGEPESTVVAEAKTAKVFGTKAPVATLEHLVLMYLYSNQPRHIGDLARIVTESDVKLADVERYLMDVHPEMLSVLKERVHAARHPPPPPPRPKSKRR